MLLTDENVQLPVNRKQRRSYQHDRSIKKSKCPKCGQLSGFYIDTKNENRIHCVINNCDTGENYTPKDKVEKPVLPSSRIKFTKEEALKVQQKLDMTKQAAKNAAGAGQELGQAATEAAASFDAFKQSLDKFKKGSD